MKKAEIQSSIALGIFNLFSVAEGMGRLLFKILDRAGHHHFSVHVRWCSYRWNAVQYKRQSSAKSSAQLRLSSCVFMRQLYSDTFVANVVYSYTTFEVRVYVRVPGKSICKLLLSGVFILAYFQLEVGLSYNHAVDFEMNTTVLTPAMLTIGSPGFYTHKQIIS